MANRPGPVESASKLTDSILRVLFAGSLQAVLAAEIAAFPVLGIWPLKQILSALQNYFAGRLRVGLMEYAIFSIIEFKTDQERREFSDTVAALKAAIAKGDLNDPDLLRKSEALDAALDRLVHFDGAFTPRR